MEQSQRLVETGDLPVVGVNIHRVPDEEDTLLRDVAERKIEPHDEHVERIAAFKKSRDRTALAAALGRVREAAAGTANLVPIVTDALDAGATAGEIAGTMREGLGLDYDPLGCIRSPVA
jgi:methylmalonyl-CoA mutase N-terminal domain/subunit